MAALRILSALITRLRSIPGITALVDDRIYPRHLSEGAEPAYPCITLFQVDGSLAVWAPRTTDSQHFLIQIYSQVGPEECYALYELVTAALHEQKTLTSTGAACFHQVREIWSNSGMWLADTNAWQLSMQYQARASITG